MSEQILVLTHEGKRIAFTLANIVAIMEPSTDKGKCLIVTTETRQNTWEVDETFDQIGARIR